MVDQFEASRPVLLDERTSNDALRTD